MPVTTNPVAQYVAAQTKAAPWWPHLVTDAADLFRTTTDLVLGKSLTPAAVGARQAIIWTLRQRGLSSPAIGALLGLDHTTVLYSVRRTNNDPDALWAAHRVARPYLPRRRTA